MIVDGLGNSLYVQLTGGQISDIAVVYELLGHVNVSASVVMADKAYGAAEFRIKINSGAAYCIPPKSNTIEPWDVDWWQYKERSRVECFFQKIKNYRRIATRYDKLAVSISRLCTFGVYSDMADVTKYALFNTS